MYCTQNTSTTGQKSTKNNNRCFGHTTTIINRSLAESQHEAKPVASNITTSSTNIFVIATSSLPIPTKVAVSNCQQFEQRQRSQLRVQHNTAVYGSYICTVKQTTHRNPPQKHLTPYLPNTSPATSLRDTPPSLNVIESLLLRSRFALVAATIRDAHSRPGRLWGAIALRELGCVALCGCRLSSTAVSPNAFAWDRVRGPPTGGTRGGGGAIVVVSVEREDFELRWRSF